MSQPPRPAPTAPPWWRGAVIYQVYLRSFADSNGDGIGDLKGLVARRPIATSATTSATIARSTRASARSMTSTRCCARRTRAA
jgi:hypothetical protein